MSSTNVVVIDGYLGRDPELRTSAAGMSFLSFSVAVKSRMRKGDEYIDRTDWIDCKTAGKRAEALARVLEKGKFCVVTGRLQVETWEKDGNKRSKTVVFVDNVALGPLAAGASRDPSRRQPPVNHPDPGMDAPDDDDIPF